MAIGLALLVSADPVTIGKFSLALEEFSLFPDVCRGRSAVKPLSSISNWEKSADVFWTRFVFLHQIEQW